MHILNNGCHPQIHIELELFLVTSNDAAVATTFDADSSAVVR